MTRRVPLALSPTAGAGCPWSRTAATGIEARGRRPRGRHGTVTRRPAPPRLPDPWPAARRSGGSSATAGAADSGCEGSAAGEQGEAVDDEAAHDRGEDDALGPGPADRERQPDRHCEGDEQEDVPEDHA